MCAENCGKRVKTSKSQYYKACQKIMSRGDMSFKHLRETIGKPDAWFADLHRVFKLKLFIERKEDGAATRSKEG